jgi:hypothetical protein
MCARDGCDGVAGWNIEMWQLAAHLRFERRNRDGLRDGMLLRTQSGPDRNPAVQWSPPVPRSCAGAPVEPQVLVIKSPANGRRCINSDTIEGTADILPPKRVRERARDHRDRMVGSAADRQTHPQRGRRQQRR